MKNGKYLLLIFFTLFLPPLYAQDEIVSDVRVAVLPLWFQEDDNVGPILSSTVQNTIQWTLRFIESYTLIETPEYPAGQSEMTDYIKANSLDNVIYGRVNSQNGKYSVSLLLYETKTDQVMVIKQGSVERSLEIFDLADEMSINLLEEFIGRKLVFGSLYFTNNGEGPGHNRVYINGTSYGDNIDSIDSFLSGEYRLQVDQINGKDEITVFDEMIKVSENDTVFIDYRTIQYGYINEIRKGPDIPYSLTINGEPADGETKRRITEEGVYTYLIEQMDYMNNPYTILEKTLEIIPGEEYTIPILTAHLGRGYNLKTKNNGNYRVSIDGQDYGPNLKKIDVLPQGTHFVEISQIFRDQEVPVFKKQVLSLKNKPVKVFFPLYESITEAKKSQWKLNHDLSINLQTLGGSWASVGLNYRLLKRRVSITVLMGFNYYEGAANMTAQIKGAWVPLGEYIISPYIGPSVIISTNFENLSGYAGMDLGIIFNPDLGFFSSVYADAGLYYHFGDERFRLGIKYTVGFLLF